MFFSLFSPDKIDEFANELAQDVARRYPPAIANNPAQIVSERRLAAILDEIFSGTHRFNHEHRLGILRKAKLGNAFQWMLKGMGYDGKFIDIATRKLLVSLTREPVAAVAPSKEPGAVE
jgi:hypothetical protein